MPRINIIGASGTGKSTLGSALAQKLDCRHFDSDSYFHLPTDPPFQAQRPQDQRLSLLVNDLEGLESWVLSGSVIGWGSHPALSFSLIVFLQLPAEIRLARIRTREQSRYGARIEPGGDMYQDHQDFMHWTAGYDSGQAALNNILIHSEWLEQQSAPVLRLQQAQSIQEQLEQILTLL